MINRDSNTGLSDDLGGLSVAQLLRLWSRCTGELRSRGVIHTRNMVGEIAELIAHAYLGGTRGSFTQAGWDIQTASGERVQVKALWRTSDTRRTNAGAIRDRNYDSLLVIEFDEHFETAVGLRLSRDLVEELFAVTPYTNGRTVKVTQKLRTDPRVATVDLTPYLSDL